MVPITVDQFVLDRIAEDESTALEAIGTGVSPDRLLATLTAYKAVVKHFQRNRTEDHQALAERAVEALAGIWQDHPDFRQEWA